MAEFYKKHPIICTIWAFMEVVCFGGVVFGWASLVFVLKEEGFYVDLCDDDKVILANTALNDTLSIDTLGNNSLTNKAVYSITKDNLNNSVLNTSSNIITTSFPESAGIIKMHVCQAQESRLNLWFSIAVSFMYLSFTGIGYIIRRFGTRKTRLSFICIYLLGTLCLAFATPAIPWLLLPGLCCMGTAGLVVLATNLQVANLHPHLRSTIVAIFTGLFDSSSIVKQLVKLAYKGGIERKYSYIFISVAFGVVVTTSTLFFMPKKNISEEHVQDIKRRRSSVRAADIKRLKRADDGGANKNGNNREVLLKSTPNNQQNGKDTGDVTSAPSHASLCDSLTSLTFVLHLYWLFVHALRFVTFIGLLNVWLANVVDGDEMKVSELLGVFSYLTMGAIGTALLCGFVYDWQRTKFLDCGPIKRVYVPVVLPMCLVIFYSICTTVLCYIRHRVTPYLAFIVFTFFRASMFTVAVAFVGDAFPMDYFGVMFGFIQLAAGIAGLLQYPIFEWFDAYEGSYAHVNILLLALQVSTIIHPVLLWIRGQRDHGHNKDSLYVQEMIVEANSPENGDANEADE